MHEFRASMNLPRQLVDEAMRLSGASTRTAAVIMGLEELVRRKKIEAMVRLAGKGTVAFDEKEYDALRVR